MSVFVELPASAGLDGRSYIGTQDGTGLDCAICALATLTTLPYQYVWERVPRAVGGGTHWRDVATFLKTLRDVHSQQVSFPIADMINSFPVKNSTLPTFLQERYRRAYLRTTGVTGVAHAIAWIDGKIYDSSGYPKRLGSYNVHAIIPVEFNRQRFDT